MLDKVAMLFAPTMRSRAYAQMMCAHNLLPNLAIALKGDETPWEGAESVQTNIDSLVFRPGESCHETLEGAGIQILDLDESDVNSDVVVNLLSELDESIIVYSGPAGVLLKNPILDLGKRILHVHGGVAPQYRGSTAFYFSLLREGSIGATALYLDKGIDTGPIIQQKTTVPEPGVEIDRILDPLLRASLLVEVLRMISDDVVPEGSTSNVRGTTYHVIHPVLKHLAIKRANARIN